MDEAPPRWLHGGAICLVWHAVKGQSIGGKAVAAVRTHSESCVMKLAPVVGGVFHDDILLLWMVEKSLSQLYSAARKEAKRKNVFEFKVKSR